MSSKIYDQNRLRKNYPLLRVKPVYSQIVVGEAGNIGGIDVETAIIPFVNSFSEPYSFQKTYTAIPTVAISPETENVNIFVTALTNTEITIQSSAPFTGSVHLQIFSEDWSMLYEHGNFLFGQDETIKRIDLQKAYQTSPVVKISNSEDLTLHLTEVQNSYFVINKNTNKSTTVYYVVIERS